MTILIGINGQFRHGKSYVAKYLEEAAELAGLSSEIVSFATPLKALCEREFGWDGKKDEKGRRLLQVVGTEGGRAYDPDIWVRKWVEEVEAISGVTGVVIADDMRFGNELDAILELGGFPLRVNRLNGDRSLYREPGMEHLYSHPSEGALECPRFMNCYSGDLDTLRSLSFEFLAECKGRKECRDGQGT